MASVATIRGAVSVVDANGAMVLNRPYNEEIADVVGENGLVERYTLSAAFVALTAPTGATLVVLRWISGTGTWTLKGVTGDTGIALGTPDATSPPFMFEISSPSIGITGSAAGELEAVWL